MKLSALLLGAASTTVFAYPGMKGSHADLYRHIRRQGPPPPGSPGGPGGPPPGGPPKNTQLIGDLTDANLTAVGQQVKNCITGQISCQDNTPKVG